MSAEDLDVPRAEAVVWAREHSILLAQANHAGPPLDTDRRPRADGSGRPTVPGLSGIGSFACLSHTSRVCRYSALALARMANRLETDGRRSKGRDSLTVGPTNGRVGAATEQG